MELQHLLPSPPHTARPNPHCSHQAYLMMRVVRTAVLVAAILVPTACGQCLTTIAAVKLRDQYTDTSLPRTYNLCPNTVYQVGTFVAGDIPPFSGGDAFFTPRPNVQVLCGDDGSSANNCTIIGGTVHVAASTIVGMTEPPTNVVFSGLTFAETNRYSFWGNMPGDITFNDCIFKVSQFNQCSDQKSGIRLTLGRLCVLLVRRTIRKQSHLFCSIMLTKRRLMSSVWCLLNASSW